jgi:hypothetical protein
VVTGDWAVITEESPGAQLFDWEMTSRGQHLPERGEPERRVGLVEPWVAQSFFMPLLFVLHGEQLIQYKREHENDFIALRRLGLVEPESNGAGVPGRPRLRACESEACRTITRSDYGKQS